MKKSILLLAVVLIFSIEGVMAQKFPSLDKSPMDATAYPNNWRISDKLVKIIYGRPKLKGRSLNKLAPKGKIWRTGANEATEITFYKNVTFGGKEVKAGTYTVFTIPADNEWTVILSTAKNVWGSYFYKETEDVVRVKGNVMKAKKTIENFSITFNGEGNNVIMYLGWGNIIISTSIKG